MASYDLDLLETAERLLHRESRQRGPLPQARIRRSISTTYYALFHFILDEVCRRVIGTHNSLSRRRRILARTLSHRGLRRTFDKLRGRAMDASVAEFLAPSSASGAASAAPDFARNLGAVFVDAQSSRHDADYDLNEPLSEKDARDIVVEVRGAIADWRAADRESDRDFKQALSVLALLEGQLRGES